MVENNDNIKEEAIINLSRNSPVALVVGAAGFLGSYLTEKLLDHRIQVIGVDNLSTGLKENLSESVKNSRFHFINDDAQYLIVNLPRLDYLFITAGEEWHITKVLNLAKKFNSKIIFISWIDLYSVKNDIPWFKKAEGELAQFAKEHKLNARVLRLAPTFGPRMNFEVSDPMVSLILASLSGKLQEESSALDFSTRALYIEDAVNLIVKSMLSGSTAWKIFDGVAPPVKVAEVKEILLDPAWHENRGFKLTELPPWPTPNLERTQTELHWQVETSLVEALKKTLTYFKNHQLRLPKPKPPDQKKEEVLEKVTRETTEKAKRQIPWGSVIALLVIFYALIYPLVSLFLGVLFVNLQTRALVEHFKKGQFEESLSSIAKAKTALNQIQDATAPFSSFTMLLFQDQSEKALKSIKTSKQSLEGSEHLVLGTKLMHQALKSVSGEVADDPGSSFQQAEAEFQIADQALAPISLDQKEDQTTAYLSNLAQRGRNLTKFLPKVIGLDSQKNYLVVAQDSSELRPSGGLISGLYLLIFDHGHLKKIQAENINELDAKLGHIEPPKELKEDLGKSSWSLKDANWEVDFPTSARQVKSFYTKATGLRVDGVLAFDSKVAKDLADTSVDDKDLLNKLFFGSSSRFDEIFNMLTTSLEKKDLLLYFNDPPMQSFLQSNHWIGAMPEVEIEGENFLSLVEANIGGNKTNYFLDRKMVLDVLIGEGGVLSQSLKISYTNRSKNDIWPGGIYKARVHILVPLGSKLVKIKWGDEDLNTKTAVFTDYGRTAYSMLISLGVAQTKTLTLDYQLPGKVKLEEGMTSYSLKLVKQPGTGADQVSIKLPGDKVISTDLSLDRKIAAEISP